MLEKPVGGGDFSCPLSSSGGLRGAIIIPKGEKRKTEREPANSKKNEGSQRGEEDQGVRRW